MLALEDKLWLGVFLIISLLVYAFLWYLFILEQKIKNEYRLIADAEKKFIRKALLSESDEERIAILGRASDILVILDGVELIDEEDEGLTVIRGIREILENRLKPL